MNLIEAKELAKIIGNSNIEVAAVAEVFRELNEAKLGYMFWFNEHGEVTATPEWSWRTLIGHGPAWKYGMDFFYSVVIFLVVAGAFIADARWAVMWAMLLVMTGLLLRWFYSFFLDPSYNLTSWSWNGFASQTRWIKIASWRALLAKTR